MRAVERHLPKEYRGLPIREYSICPEEPSE